MPDMEIQSHRGVYRARFASPFAGLEELRPGEHLIIDAKVAELYKEPLKRALAGESVLKIDATEPNKSLEKIPDYVTHLLECGIKRDHTLIAVGGGIIQDITAFIAATLLRGLHWRFYPTTLLAQADSCIGSKSSINVGEFKNQVGTFTPPDEVIISTDVLGTLTDTEMRSGFGEMIKVHVISGRKDTDMFLRSYPRLREDRALLEKTIRRSLEIKKGFIEKDEFDLGDRLVLNYGHSFGHAIESATEYAVPHGIAVTIGMDMANRFSEQRGLLSRSVVEELSPVLKINSAGYESVPIPFERFFPALRRDKKASSKGIRLALLKGPGEVFIERISEESELRTFCEEYLESRCAGVGERA